MNLRQNNDYSTIFWLRQLPEGYREQALSELNESARYRTEEKMSRALLNMCDWTQTSHGFDFWSDVTFHYEAREMFGDSWLGSKVGTWYANRYAPLPPL